MCEFDLELFGRGILWREASAEKSLGQTIWPL